MNTDAQAASDEQDTVEAARIPLTRALEAMLFLADEPTSLVALATACGAPVAQVRDALAELQADYDGVDGIERAFELREIGGGWRLYVRDTYDEVLEDFIVTRQPPKLSQAALETLAVIAYRQPVTRQQVANVRAVNVDSVVRTLVARGLLEEAGQDGVTGATLYVTSDRFLEVLGINSLEDLPKISPLLADGHDLGDWQEEMA
ncbi:SMC-Scp complex subunit ScpB [Pseudoclavibacter alba]|uniref:SMC-Scp complex subunit ScpB n=1 Tax=Pseudoclavibacter albus TaxID=272241 RepID=UPI0019D12602|nr:SMC-Scp complex subunit ScpB [Pseudoclavibacter alba]MBN6778729.1 SMC-Scp complex subunit ScpB [Pseudoclavibacter alba]